jgi:hypothetical protein
LLLVTAKPLFPTAGRQLMTANRLFFTVSQESEKAGSFSARMEQLFVKAD